ncbi:MAG: 6,7-dimethyl-8-ribityllumazine synthase [Acidimicrobiia bacterium]|nr:6,7-dimethyl-8-ribityllumazine synthase [Acidimicrobiia bacterium]NNL27070.1 6,7-dimethyl-8-ribityllumazine synthase [Acidimicrobiia bacterium]
MTSASDLRIGIAVAAFNEVITAGLLSAAEAALVDVGEVTVVRVPGAWELPLAARALALDGVDGVVAIGAVIEGETDHYQFIAAEASRGLQHVMLETGVPVGNALLTVRKLEHARERSAPGAGNKGTEAASAVLDTIRALRSI